MSSSGFHPPNPLLKKDERTLLAIGSLTGNIEEEGYRIYNQKSQASPARPAPGDDNVYEVIGTMSTMDGLLSFALPLVGNGGKGGG
ncbi:hypothetical protein FRC19_000238 [Serendipita sp. 401]|nr:hypothetical protein FRC19_000238 [Serendipita sp. 401]